MTLRGCESTSKGLTPKANQIKSLGRESCLEGLAPFWHPRPLVGRSGACLEQAWKISVKPTWAAMAAVVVAHKLIVRHLAVGNTHPRPPPLLGTSLRRAWTASRSRHVDPQAVGSRQRVSQWADPHERRSRIQCGQQCRGIHARPRRSGVEKGGRARRSILGRPVDDTAARPSHLKFKIQISRNVARAFGSGGWISRRELTTRALPSNPNRLCRGKRRQLSEFRSAAVLGAPVRPAFAIFIAFHDPRI